MAGYDSPDRSNLRTGMASPHQRSPKSTIEYEVIEQQNSIRLLTEAMSLEHKSVVKESLNSKARFKSNVVKLQKCLNPQNDRVRFLESEYEQRKAASANILATINALEEAHALEEERVQVQTLNLEILREFWHDEAFAQMYPNKESKHIIFGAFDEQATTREDLAVIRNRLEQVQRLYHASKSGGQLFKDEPMTQQGAKMKLEAIQKYNRINSI
jgi:paraquat-inducible protein B